MPDWRAFYRGEATVYHRARYGTWYGGLFGQLHHEELHEIFGMKAGASRGLDCSTGTGQTLEVLIHYCDWVVATDITFEMLEQCRDRMERNQSAAMACSDTLKLPFGQGTFDVVASSRFLHLLPEALQERAVDEMLRVLKQGGLLVVDYYNERHYKWLAIPISVYRILLRKRPSGDTVSRIASVRTRLKTRGDLLLERGVGSYLLAPTRILPRRLQRRVARLFRIGVLAGLAEQVIFAVTKKA